MFKFGFGKKRKEKETQKSTAQGPVRELSEEEKKKVDKKKVDLDSAVAALKAMGKTDEEIARLFPRPLSEEEQKEKEKQLEDLFRQQNYAKVISAGTALMERSAFTGKIYQNVGFLIGMSAVFAKNPEALDVYGGFAVIHFCNFPGYTNKFGAEGALEVLERGENLLPGCMHRASQQIYPYFRDYYGDDHEYTLKIKKYL